MDFADTLTDEFQSTHPVRGGTLYPSLGKGLCKDFNPPTP